MRNHFNNTGNVSKVLILACMVILLGSLFIMNGFDSAIAGEKNVKQLLSKSVVGDKEMRNNLNLVKINQEFIKRVETKVIAHRNNEVFQQKIREYPAEKKMAAFLRNLELSEMKGISTQELLNSFTKQKQAQLKSLAGGSISGTVTVEGAASIEYIEVIAFNEFGFFVGSAVVDFSGSYTIFDLPAGNYYVVTRSGFVDEFYSLGDDVLLESFRNWRDADLVAVQDGGAVTGIDFDLLQGAKITGHIFEADGVTPILNRFVDFEISRVMNPDVQFETSTFTDGTGFYEINLPGTGFFKMQANVFGYEDEYYNNQADWQNATPINIPTLNDSIPNIIFSLEEETITVVEGAHITGTVLGPNDVPVPLAIVFAFNVTNSDTTIAGLGFAGEGGVYDVTPLEAGDYVVYANDYLSFILPLLMGTSSELPPLQGEYWQEVPTSDQAAPVTVANMDTTFGINFTLEMGGMITGNITDASGDSLESVVVVAVKDFSTTGVGKFFSDDIDFGISFTDSAGNYVIGGLSSGDYVLRTVSLLDETLMSKNIIDAYYPNVHSIFDFNSADRVTVNSPAVTPGIDFALDNGGYISGHFYELDGQTPIVMEALAIAFDAQTNYPALAIPIFDPEGMGDGSFEIRPLPSGDYKLLGLVVGDILGGDEVVSGLGRLSKVNLDAVLLQQDEDVIYLPQFYNGKKSLDTADPVTVTAPNEKADIDFSMVRAAVIQGVVNLPTGNPVGADTLAETLVLAYDATTNLAIGGTETNFAGGYSIMGLPPGNYKIEALTMNQGVASAYHGGGTTFDDANSTVVTVAPDEKKPAIDIDLTTGEGVISGTVYNSDGSEQLPFVLVIAYDATGHAVSIGVSGINFNTGVPLPNQGEYYIPGLAAGNYFVRTFALFQLFMLLEEVDLEGDLGDDPLGAGLGLLLGGGLDMFGELDIQVFSDTWYQNIPVEFSLDNIDIFSLLFGLILSEGDPLAIIPWFDIVPQGATQVTVTSPGGKTGVDFHLPDLLDILTDVEENFKIAAAPETFELSQNYPNPFNPSTVINYHVPAASQVQLHIYNIIGQRIKTLFDGRRETGVYTAQWDGLNNKGQQAAAGIYILRMETDNLSLSRKMLLIK